MRSFQEQLEEDLDQVFLDLSMFGEVHEIEGKEITICLDTEYLAKQKTEGRLGLEEASVLFFAKTEDLPKPIPVGNSIEIDGRDCTVMEWIENKGITSVTLNQIRGR